MSQTSLNNDDRFALLRSVGEECIQESELRNLIEKKPHIRCYDGFEPSGRMHIAQGVLKAINVNKCTISGCEFVFWVADWFALMNDKVGGELEKIRTVGRYLMEVWKAIGMDMSKVTFLWSSDEITAHADIYWKLVMDIGRRNTIARIKKCCTIMGKTEGTLTAAQVLYPLMQCADIFFLKADVCQLGLDQRKVNMLAREYCDLTGRKLKPVILSHHMLAGLKKGQAKMSKSDPDSAIFMEDSADDVRRKIQLAYCPCTAQTGREITDDGAPEVNEDKNPILDYYQCVVFAGVGSSTTVGDRCFTSYAELEAAFLANEVSEEQIKETLIREINSLLDPVRRHFENNTEAGNLLELVKSYRTTSAPAAAEKVIQSVETSRPPLACMWLPAVLRLPLNTAMGLIRAANEFMADNEGGQVVLLLPEWTAFACDDISGDEKDIHAALQLNLALLQAYGLPASVRVIRESEHILGNRSEFWVTAINVGRRYTLSSIEDLHHGGLKNAGQVVGALMRVANAVLLDATHVISTIADAKMAALVCDYTDGKVSHRRASLNVPIPPLHRPDDGSTPLGLDDVLYIDDNDMDIRRKIKKAYCAPQENDNPIISLAVFALSENGELVVERAEANGGNVTYIDEAQLRSDCESGILHPADLKATVTLHLMNLSAAGRVALGTPEVKKLIQSVRNVEKKLAKKK